MITKLLIANRGDSACRVAATCRRLGIAAATVHAPIDAGARHVRTIGESVLLGGAQAADGYLDGAAMVAAAGAVGADAVHPGIGFLSEDPAFARLVEDAGLAFVGPRADTLERFADKASARAEAAAAGIPVIEGPGAASADPNRVAAMARALAPPLLLKAAGGGGGRGVRVVRHEADLDAAIASAMGEADATFGRPDLLVERYIDGARHIEVQIAGDGDGDVVHLLERECSVQRRFQKVVEEAPAPGLAEEVRAAVLTAAVELGRRARFRGLGTVEFLVRGTEHVFLEVNPRLQVEHPVSEAITGLDLVELQLRIASGGGLGLTQDRIQARGHAIEARLYAEDAASGLLPSSGVVHRIALPEAGLRVDACVDAGDAVTAHFDPLIAKLIAHGARREEALATLRAALPGVRVLGVDTNLAFMRRLLDHPQVAAGAVDTGFVERHLEALTGSADAPPPALFAVAGCIGLGAWRSGPATDPWTAPDFTGWRLAGAEVRPSGASSLLVAIGGTVRALALSPMDVGGRLHVRIDDQVVVLRLEAGADDTYLADIGGTVHGVRAIVDGGTVHLDGRLGAATARISLAVDDAGARRASREGRLLAPVAGLVSKVEVMVGDRVSAGDVLVVQESMKMVLRLAAPCDGVVAELGCAEGDMIARHSLVAEVRPPQVEAAAGGADSARREEP